MIPIVLTRRYDHCLASSALAMYIATTLAIAATKESGTREKPNASANGLKGSES